MPKCSEIALAAGGPALKTLVGRREIFSRTRRSPLVMPGHHAFESGNSCTLVKPQDVRHVAMEMVETLLAGGMLRRPAGQ
jgi:hypothetical protein